MRRQLQIELAQESAGRAFVRESEISERTVVRDQEAMLDDDRSVPILHLTRQRRPPQNLPAEISLDLNVAERWREDRKLGREAVELRAGILYLLGDLVERSLEKLAADHVRREVHPQQRELIAERRRRQYGDPQVALPRHDVAA
ncbi:MAG: hypothetical protein H0T42_12485 [Deltaproteobacteria bacterium]|nr:hypothetical protein [Deltaproteobacteria bacterium]